MDIPAFVRPLAGQEDQVPFGVYPPSELLQECGPRGTGICKKRAVALDRGMNYNEYDR